MNSGAYNRYGRYGYGPHYGGGWGGWGFDFPWNWFADVPYALEYLNPCLYAPCPYPYSNAYPGYPGYPTPYGVYNTPDPNAPPANYGSDPNQPQD